MSSYARADFGAAAAKVCKVPLCRPSNLVRRTTGSVNYARSMVALRLIHLRLLQLIFQPSQIIHRQIETISVATVAFLKLHFALIGKVHFLLSLPFFDHDLNSPRTFFEARDRFSSTHLLRAI